MMKKTKGTKLDDWSTIYVVEEHEVGCRSLSLVLPFYSICVFLSWDKCIMSLCYYDASAMYDVP
jgi:hypothetical protein